MFRKVLIANRGVIACRVIRTLRRMGVGSVAVYSEADRHSLPVKRADEAVLIGPPAAAQSYLSVAAILAAARKTGAEAIHPGYGFLSENAEFAEACADSRIVFIGPTPAQMRAFGLKDAARRLAEENQIPLLPGTGLLRTAGEALRAAEAIGYPVMLKSIAGGGGIGMKMCSSAAELQHSYNVVQRLSCASFGSGGLYLERFVPRARHIEVQIFGDGRGTVLALGERDCSAQRRNQKVIEETPAPNLAGGIRAKLLEMAARMGRAVDYQSAGTVEFIYDTDTANVYFLEVNARLQVEHGVTEEVTGVDLVEWMIRLAAGEMPPLENVKIHPVGCSVQARIYAEDPATDFQPRAGPLSSVRWPKSARVETWVEPGAEVTPYYDPLLAKIIVCAPNRATALSRLRDALTECQVAGTETNLSYVQQVIADSHFKKGGVITSFLQTFKYQRSAIEVIEPGTQTTIQDYPGRLGYWHVGVPPSGPMDVLAFRLANRLVGNADSAAGLEVAVMGPTLRFACDAVIALTGADFGPRLDGVPIPRWRSLFVRAGSLLEMTLTPEVGSRAYLAIAGGIDVPQYLGSRSTFILGRFGGQAGRVLRAGDILHVMPLSDNAPRLRDLPVGLVPQYSNEWQIGVLYGPHGAPDFFATADIDMLLSTAWKVHYNSDRTGVRLIGPKPVWARRDGGEAGLHPSNIHDNAYAVGTINFTGDMPVILGPDGPSLGGFVCPVTIVQAEVWKIGQLKPGDVVRFRAISMGQAMNMEVELETCIKGLSGRLLRLPEAGVRDEPILRTRPATREAPGVVYRSDGDKYLLIEYGPNVLDLNLRFRVHALEEQLRAADLPGIIDITPGVRSLHVHYDGRLLKREALLEALDACEDRVPEFRDIVVPSRTIHLPLSWDDPAVQLAIRKYMQSVRPDAPWCPSNIEFIRRINGLASIDEVYRIVFAASYLVLGLGDVYLGAPVATPVDPRHRLVTTKYNPARTWTPENAVGIGGAYLCVYGMEGPGGYQFVGRTLQMWNTFRSTLEFPDRPWLLQFFDRICFYAVTTNELLEIRDCFPHGGYPLRIEHQKFRLKDYQEFLASIDEDVVAFKQRQRRAFLEERERWSRAGTDKFLEPVAVEASAAESDDRVLDGCLPIRSPIAASIWNVAVERGQRVAAGQRLVVLEAMKTEMVVAAPSAGIVERLNCVPGALVFAGQELVMLRQEAGV